MILDRKIINLPEKQLWLIRSGWGASCAENAQVEKITYLSDGLKIKGYIAYPRNIINGEKLPCIIWNRGGIGESGAIDEFTARGIYGQIASWGYAVFASQYRGNDGGEGTDEFGGGDINDAMNLIELAKELPFADASLWGVEGWSRGGMTAYHMLSRTNIFKAAIISGGITSLCRAPEQSKFMVDVYSKILGTPGTEEFKKNCEMRSALNFADKLSPNTAYLLLHGTDDERISPLDSIEMAEKLLAMKRNFRLVLLEGGDHYLKNHRKETDDMRKKWFDKYLKGIK
ncbi:MAG TPA: prolyl oligopeptidase family serine peptidase [Ignavibacteriales bacterium]|nr:prolyl oligopeptidase family serine peptidase [Ignavibacteriales bacterium]